jgi:hypothetical protein
MANSVLTNRTREMANSVLTNYREESLSKNKKDLNKLDPLTMNN